MAEIEDTQGTGEEGGGDANLKQLRAKAKVADEATAALAALQRENAILKSGIDVDSPMGKYFTETYQGEPGDVDAMVAKAKELGIPLKGETPAPPVAPVTPPEAPEPTGTEERQALASGAPADTGENADPRKEGKDRFDEAMSKGATWEEAAGQMVNHLANAAERGDPRVLANVQR